MKERELKTQVEIIVGLRRRMDIWATSLPAAPCVGAMDLYILLRTVRYSRSSSRRKPEASTLHYKRSDEQRVEVFSLSIRCCVACWHSFLSSHIDSTLLSRRCCCCQSGDHHERQPPQEPLSTEWRKDSASSNTIIVTIKQSTSR